MIKIPAKLCCDSRGCTNSVTVDLELHVPFEYPRLGYLEVGSAESIHVFDTKIPEGWIDDYGQYFCPNHKEPWSR